jgi:hypothetical protein
MEWERDSKEATLSTLDLQLQLSPSKGLEAGRLEIRENSVKMDVFSCKLPHESVLQHMQVVISIDSVLNKRGP